MNTYTVTLYGETGFLGELTNTASFEDVKAVAKGKIGTISNRQPVRMVAVFLGDNFVFGTDGIRTEEPVLGQ